MKRAVSLLLVVLVSCGKKSEPTPPPIPPSDPEPELVPLSDLQVAGLDEIDTEKLIERPSPAPTELRWDFSPDRRYAFAIALRETVLTSVTYKGTVTCDARLKGKGMVEFAGGKVWFKTQMTDCAIDGKPSTAEEINKLPAAKFEYRIREDGSVVDAKQLSGSDSAIVEFLFRLPKKALAPGQSESGTFEKESDGYRLAGTITTTLTGHRKVERYDCARLVTDVDLTMTPVSGNAGKGLMRVRVVAYFAPEERRFVRVEAASSYVMHTKQKFDEPGKPQRWSLGSFVSDAIYRLRLVDN